MKEETNKTWENNNGNLYYILKDILGYSPDGEIGTLAEQGLEALKEFEQRMASELTSATIKAKAEVLKDIEENIELEKEMLSKHGKPLTKDLGGVIKGLNLAWITVNAKRLNLEKPSK